MSITPNIVLYQVKDRVATVTLNRPDKRNALNAEMVAALRHHLSLANEDDAVKVVIIKGEGKAFCSGADLDSLQSMQHNSYEQNLADSSALAELFEQIYLLNKVSIAAIHGPALAGGCGLATVCDFSFAVPEALFGYTEVRIGFVPAIVSWFLLQKVGQGVSRRLLLSGEIIKGSEAQHLGLINFVVQPEDLETAVNEYASKLVHQNSGAAMAQTRQLLAKVAGLQLSQAMQETSSINATARAHAECKKGIAAFLNKQPIDWIN